MIPIFLSIWVLLKVEIYSKQHIGKKKTLQDSD